MATPLIAISSAAALHLLSGDTYEGNMFSLRMNIDATRLSEQVHVYDREQLLRISLYYNTSSQFTEYTAGH